LHLISETKSISRSLSGARAMDELSYKELMERCGKHLSFLLEVSKLMIGYEIFSCSREGDGDK